MSPRPQWPPDLVAEVPDALDGAACDLVLALGRELPQSDGGVARHEGEAPHRDDSVRRVRQSVLPRAGAAAAVYERVGEVVDRCNREWFGFDVDGLHEDLVLVEYGVGAFYNWHLDAGPAAPTRKLSVSVALSDPTAYAGGGLSFPGREVAGVARGSAVVFPSFLLHAVQPVTSGRRHALLAWAGGPRFR